MKYLSPVLRKTVLAIIMAGAVAPLVLKAQTHDPAGYWVGAVERDGKTWRVAVRIERSGDAYRVLVDFPDADGYGREFVVSASANGRIVLTRPQPSGIPIVFEGVVEGNKFRGVWSGFGQKATFTLSRGEWKPLMNREADVSFRNGPVTLAGTLITPVGKGPFPAVVITHGGTPNERAGYRGWAMHFVRAGFAALIYDKRGSGSSTGDTRSASIEDLASDAATGVQFLRSNAGIDPKRIGVAGHSQGGWIAPTASTMIPDVAFVIASAASGVSPDKQSIHHRANVMREAGFPEQTIALASDIRSRLYVTGRMLLEGDPRAAAERVKISAELQRYANEPWLDEAALPPNLDNDKPTTGGLRLLFFEPEPMWEKVKVPVLLVWGDKDTVVPVENGRAKIEAALRRGGNTNFTVKIFPNVDHGVTLVPEKGEWDFPRVDLGYYKFMTDWASRIVKR